MKKLIEEANTAEDTRRLLQFCCWENPQFSHAVLYELLWQIAFAYTYELRPYLDLLLHMLCMEDSWQNHRCDLKTDLARRLDLSIHSDNAGFKRP